MKRILTGSIILVIVAFGALVCLRCTGVSGGGSEAGNARITGKVMDAAGSPAGSVVVQIAPSDFDPAKDAPVYRPVTTGPDGRYWFTVEINRTYTIQAVHSVLRTRALVAGVEAREEDDTIPECIMSPPGAVKVMLPAGIDTAAGYIYIPGTTIFAFVNNAADFVVLDSAPVGLIPEISYSSKNRAAAAALRYNVPVTSRDTSFVRNPLWKYARTFGLNTSPTGANVAGTVVHFPVLIRLNSGSFNFSQAQSAGMDIMFTKDNEAPLPFEIERWDSAAGLAEVWVMVDTVFGNSDTQSISMYWGNSSAAIRSNGAAVFDTARGFMGVWHLAEAGNTTAYDATSNRYNGVPSGMSAASAVTGIVGTAQDFNGTTGCITMPATAGGKLDFPQNGSYSMSLWAYVDTMDTVWHAIAGKGHEQYYLQLKCLPGNRATWEFVEFQDQRGWEYTEDSTTAVLGSSVWVYLTGVREGEYQYLYINGVLVNDSAPLMGGSYTRNTTDDFTVGRYAREVMIPYPQGWSYFNGKIDEVRVLRSASSTDWVKLCYMNQKADDALVVVRK